ncbi:uncharacterized protein LOC123508620 [Portunus trituberculatus]|uniref:uncharacterized protein LOC123508620 n=1 Tax=Portunus trituberculatus TaxID=210409 RepID=UPI001E1CB14C|nr:uncharacterized protein LOC123508620 [Portunus trituberculatus]
MVPPRCAPSEEITRMSDIWHYSQRTYCTGGEASREAPLCVPAHHFTEHMKVLQSFKKGGTHTLLHYKLLEVQRHTAHFFPKRVCRVQDRVARMEDASTFTASLVHAFFIFFCVCVCGKKCTQF